MWKIVFGSLVFIAGVVFVVYCGTHPVVYAENSNAISIYDCGNQVLSMRACRVYDPKTQRSFVAVEYNTNVAIAPDDAK